MSCETCWTEASFQAAALGGMTADRYVEQLHKHPEHELHSFGFTQREELPLDCPGCGYQIGSFACKIRHLQINTGSAKAANDA